MVVWIHIIFSLVLNKMAVILALKLEKIFCGLNAASSFSALWRTANITKGSSPQFSLGYRPISITPTISKVYEKLISRMLYKFVDSIKFLPNTQLDFRKGLGTTDALLL